MKQPRTFRAFGPIGYGPSADTPALAAQRFLARFPKHPTISAVQEYSDTGNTFQQVIGILAGVSYGATYPQGFRTWSLTGRNGTAVREWIRAGA